MRSQSLRAFVEVAPDNFVPRERLAFDTEALAGAAAMLKADIRMGIGGMAPLMAEDRGRPKQSRRSSADR